MANNSPNIPRITSQIAVKTNWWLLTGLGFAVGPVSLIGFGMLVGALTIPFTIFAGVMFGTATPYILAGIPFSAVVFLLGLLLKLMDIAKPYTQAFAVLSFVYSLTAVAYQLLVPEGAWGLSMLIVLFVGLFSGLVLPLFVWLEQRMSEPTISRLMIICATALDVGAIAVIQR
jgi:hypothetical protein